VTGKKDSKKWGLDAVLGRGRGKEYGIKHFLGLMVEKTSQGKGGVQFGGCDWVGGDTNRGVSRAVKRTVNSEVKLLMVNNPRKTRWKAESRAKGALVISKVRHP